MGNSIQIPSYSEGSYSGRIVKFSKSGYFWKTYEGEIICDGMKQVVSPNGESTSIANTLKFSIDSKSAKGENIEDIAKNIQNNLDNGKPVRLAYWSPYIGFPCRGNTTYYVYDVK